MAVSDQNSSLEKVTCLEWRWVCISSGMLSSPLLQVSALVFLTFLSGPVQTQPVSYEPAAFCVPLPLPDRRTVRAGNGAELQGALDRAEAGDTILLEAGATFHPVTPDGSFLLRRRPHPRAMHADHQRRRPGGIVAFGDMQQVLALLPG